MDPIFEKDADRKPKALRPSALENRVGKDSMWPPGRPAPRGAKRIPGDGRDYDSEHTGGELLQSPLSHHRCDTAPHSSGRR